MHLTNIRLQVGSSDQSVGVTGIDFDGIDYKLLIFTAKDQVKINGIFVDRKEFITWFSHQDGPVSGDFIIDESKYSHVDLASFGV